jgi:hypothetical protein
MALVRRRPGARGSAPVEAPVDIEGRVPVQVRAGARARHTDQVRTSLDGVPAGLRLRTVV